MSFEQWPRVFQQVTRGRIHDSHISAYDQSQVLWSIIELKSGMHEHKSFVTSHYDRSQLRNANYHSYSAMSDHSSLDYVLLDSITFFLSHEIHILKMAMPIETLDCDYKRVFRDRTNSIEIIRQIHKLSWRIYTIITFHSAKYTRL